MDVSNCLPRRFHTKDLVEWATTNAEEVFFRNLLNLIGRACRLDKLLIEIKPLNRTSSRSNFVSKKRPSLRLWSKIKSMSNERSGQLIITSDHSDFVR